MPETRSVGILSTIEPINSVRLRVAFNWLTIKGKFAVKLNGLFLLERP